MGEFGPQGRKWAVSFHVFFSALWLGSAVAMVVVMCLRPAAPRTDAELLAWCLAVKLLDDVVIIGAAAGALLTGLLLAWRTKWGFFVWYWVAFKVVSTVAMVTFGATCLGPWIDETAVSAGRIGLDALSDPAFRASRDRATVFGGLQVGLLAFVVFISVFKPWGRVGRGAAGKGGSG